MQEALNRRADVGTERTVMNRAVDWNENQAEDGGQITPLQGLAGRLPALQERWRVRRLLRRAAVRLTALRGRRTARRLPRVTGFFGQIARAAGEMADVEAASQSGRQVDGPTGAEDGQDPINSLIHLKSSFVCFGQNHI